ncbi:predicted protein [Histoplasma mississippiense (nom. inval.)]|uniref:predicted protein n=1 Tax=Ajellomyces capsulatus (strain NAm1 / WU24) TaxID=2059318 RepID=UPI000157C2EE|nr:predicted protein [Histoplasma mississippiense (nom. inval.)]EDN07885.1 predicted protein [Histoplasma mississippiense (nom. inval.)]
MTFHLSGSWLISPESDNQAHGLKDQTTVIATITFPSTAKKSAYSELAKHPTLFYSANSFCCQPWKSQDPTPDLSSASPV